MSRTAFIVASVAAATATVFSMQLAAGVQLAWHSLAAVLLFILAYGIGLAILVTLIVVASCSARPLPWIAAIAVVVSVLVFGHLLGDALASRIREQEVQAALDAGLENDCRKVFSQYENDPRFTQSGYLCLLPDSAEYQALPPSLRLLRPCYVTIEDERSGLPANIGLCKNGFGGFASGVRVFQANADIPQPFWSKPLTSTTYLWQEET